jgi:hypothetical protein
LFNLGTSLVKNDGSSPFKPLYVKDVDELVGPPDLREGLGLDGIFDKLKSDFSSLFDNIGPMLSNAFSAFTSFLGFADGGQVSGPGGPRSDSILARLSNGEFVVNANSTSKALPLLHAINDGYIPKFADGGYIGDMQAIYNSAPSRGSGNTQVIQLSVTGDVSRQTRAEILSMLPVIANGVNSRNREKGVK